MEKKPGSYHHGDLRASLVDAALAIADEEGIAALSTRAVARRLGVSHAAPARHFRDRAELLAEVAAVAFERLTAVLARAGSSAEDPPDAALAALGRAYVRFALDHPGLVRVMFSSEVADRVATVPRLESASGGAYETLAIAVRRALPPSAPGDEVEAATFLAWSSVHGAALLWLDGPMSRPAGRGAKKRFLALSDAAIDRLARSLAAGEVRVGPRPGSTRRTPGRSR